MNETYDLTMALWKKNTSTPALNTRWLAAAASLAVTGVAYLAKRYVTWTDKPTIPADDATYDELYELAKAKELRGRSTMSKQELAEALS